jgi:hypothetical protein
LFEQKSVRIEEPSSETYERPQSQIKESAKSDIVQESGTPGFKKFENGSRKVKALSKVSQDSSFGLTQTVIRNSNPTSYQ